MQRKFIFLLSVLVFLSWRTTAQEQDYYDYSSEFIWGINKSTNSGIIGGFVFRLSKEIKENRFQTFGLELINAKHPQEERFQSFQTGNGFVWGKLNYLYSIRTQYGRDYVIFKKAPQQGVQINLGFSGGPTFGIVAPYFVEVCEGANCGINDQIRTTRKPFDENVQFANIFGPGRLFQGLGESDVEIGLNLKTSITFEFGTFKSNVTGFQVGFLAEIFPNDIPLAAFHENKNFFPYAFINLFYGSRK